jgi:hypothetical protein
MSKEMPPFELADTESLVASSPAVCFGLSFKPRRTGRLCLTNRRLFWSAGHGWIKAPDVDLPFGEIRSARLATDWFDANSLQVVRNDLWEVGFCVGSALYLAVAGCLPFGLIRLLPGNRSKAVYELLKAELKGTQGAS